jgi:hypothetical protein
LSKFTPGPWRIRAIDDQEYHIDSGEEPTLQYSNWKSMAIVYGSDFHGPIGSDVARANARLIAAAPDLADELDKAHDIIRALSQAVNKYVPVDDPACSVDIRWNDRAALLEKAIGLVK